MSGAAQLEAVRHHSAGDNGMDAYSSLIDSIATLLWPVIVIIVLIVFRRAVAAVIESGKSRKFTLKVGGQELTMEEVSEQQRKIIADLQAQVVEIQQAISGGVPPREGGLASPPLPGGGEAQRILWVDDNPKNNSFLIQQLLDRGIGVDLAVSTAEGESRFGDRRYAMVISDMGRTENGRYNSRAGIDTLSGIRKRNATIPFVIFCSMQLAAEFGEEAMKLGATLVTSSTTKLTGILAGIGDA